MDLNAHKTLLALLLSLNQLSLYLTGDEIYALEEVGDLLQDDLTPWSEIATEINQILDNNSTWQELYEEATRKLAPLTWEQIQQLWPTEDRLLDELEITELSRGYFGGKPQVESQEIPNLTRIVATSDRPDKKAKKLKFLQDYWEMPQTPMF